MYSYIQKYKQTHFHKHKRIASRHAHLGLVHTAAWVLTASALLSFAKTIHHDYVKRALHHDDPVVMAEYYRTPRYEKTVHYEYDFDIGLRSPHISSG